MPRRLVCTGAAGVFRSIAACLVLACCPAGWTQSPPPVSDPAWKNLERFTGRVNIYPLGAERFSGNIEGWTTDSLTVRRRDGTPVKLAKTDVARVSRKSRAWGAFWGVLIGFAAAAPVGAYAGPYITDWGNPSATVRLRHAAGWGLFFGGIGAGIGALAGKERTIFRQPRPASAPRAQSVRFHHTRPPSPLLEFDLGPHSNLEDFSARDSGRECCSRPASGTPVEAP